MSSSATQVTAPNFTLNVNADVFSGVLHLHEKPLTSP